MPTDNHPPDRKPHDRKPHDRKPHDAGGRTETSARQASRRTRPIAVALKESGAEGGAPSVVATGRGEVAEAILNIAFALGVKVRTDADLAEMLSVVDLGEEVPSEAFHAIAEILTYLYRAQGRLDNDQTW